MEERQSCEIITKEASQGNFEISQSEANVVWISKAIEKPEPSYTAAGM